MIDKKSENTKTNLKKYQFSNFRKIDNKITNYK